MPPEYCVVQEKSINQSNKKQKKDEHHKHQQIFHSSLSSSAQHRQCRQCRQFQPTAPRRLPRLVFRWLNLRRQRVQFISKFDLNSTTSQQRRTGADHEENAPFPPPVRAGRPLLHLTASTSRESCLVSSVLPCVPI